MRIISGRQSLEVRARRAWPVAAAVVVGLVGGAVAILVTTIRPDAIPISSVQSHVSLPPWFVDKGPAWAAAVAATAAMVVQAVEGVARAGRPSA